MILEQDELRELTVVLTRSGLGTPDNGVFKSALQECLRKAAYLGYRRGTKRAAQIIDGYLRAGSASGDASLLTIGGDVDQPQAQNKAGPRKAREKKLDRVTPNVVGDVPDGALWFDRSVVGIEEDKKPTHGRQRHYQKDRPSVKIITSIAERRKWTDHEKREIVAESEEHGVTKVAKRHALSISQLSAWRKRFARGRLQLFYEGD